MKYLTKLNLGKLLVFLMITLVSLSCVCIDMFAATVEQEKQIIEVEHLPTIKPVTIGTPMEDISLPTKLRVVVKEEIKQEDFRYQLPTPELTNQYHYGTYEKDLSLQQKELHTIYTYQDEQGIVQGYRVFGNLKSESSENSPSFYSCDVDGNILGRVIDIDINWNWEAYDEHNAGTYELYPIMEGYVANSKDLLPIKLMVQPIQEKQTLSDTMNIEVETEDKASNGMPRASTPTTILMTANTRIVITKTGAKRYNAKSDVLMSYIDTSLNSAGYLIKNSDGKLLTESTNYDLIKVEEDVSVTLIFDNLLLQNNGDLSTMTRDLSQTLGGNCLNVTGADVTIILKNNTKSVLTCAFGNGIFGGGAIVKNGSNNDTHALTIQCESINVEHHRCDETKCGKLEAIGTGIHTAAIGSSLNGGICRKRGGFANFYIKGGIITANGGEHAPGIGTMCGTAHIRDLVTIADDQINDPQMLYGEICKNIQISGGRVEAKGNVGCAGIGSGWAGPVDGITISNGAYVKASGGLNSPGIGSGGANEDTPFPRVTGIYNVSNILITGGETIVEAFGSDTENSPNHDSVPGIGCGVSAEGKTGTVKNVIATPNSNWLAVVRQGSSKEGSTYINGGKPSSSSIAILPNKYYTLVYFSQISKTATVNGDVYNSRIEPLIKPGDTIVYKINCLSAIEDVNDPVIVSDVIPSGFTLVKTTGSYSSGMKEEVVNGLKKVYWENRTLTPSNCEFYFTVIVDDLISYHTYYDNIAKCETVDGLTFSSNLVRLESKAKLIRIKKVNQFNQLVSSAGFTIYKCNNTSGGHYHGFNCSYDVNDPYRKEVKTGLDGFVEFPLLALGEGYLLVETTTPYGYEPVPTGNYVMIHRSALFDEYFTFRTEGDVFDRWVSSPINSYDTQTSTITNLKRSTLFIKKEVNGSLGDKTKSFDFKVSMKDKSGALMKSTTVNCTSSSFISGVDKPAYTSIYINSTGYATISLKHGQSITLDTAIPYNGSYEVVESRANLDGYTTNSSGTVASNVTSDQTASFVNTRNGVVPSAVDEEGPPFILLALFASLSVIGCFCLRKKRLKRR